VVRATSIIPRDEGGDMISVLARHLAGLDQLLEDCRQPMSEQLGAEVVKLGQPVRIGRKQQLAERYELQGFTDQRLAEGTGVVHRQPDVHEDVTEDLGEVRGLAMKRVVVQQQYRHSELLGCSQKRGESERVSA
jgi:hypothetical protein